MHPHYFLLWSQANKLKFIPIICAVRKKNLNYYNAISSSCICFVCSLLLINLLFLFLQQVLMIGGVLLCLNWYSEFRKWRDSRAGQMKRWSFHDIFFDALYQYKFFFRCCIPAPLFYLVSSADASTLMWFFFKRKLWFFRSSNEENHVQLPCGVSSMWWQCCQLWLPLKENRNKFFLSTKDFAISFFL